MGQADLSEAVARAIADANANGTASSERLAAVAIRVVLAEARRIIEALPYSTWEIGVQGEQEMLAEDEWSVTRADVLAVLAALESPPPV